MPSKFQYRLSTLFFLTVFAAIVFACFQPESQNAKIARLVATLTDLGEGPDHNLAFSTASASALTNIGLSALDQSLDVMLIDGEKEWFRRSQASKACHGIVLRLYGWKAGRGWASNANRDEYGQLMKKLGELDHEAPFAQRKETVERWKAWFADTANLPQPVKYDYTTNFAFPGA